MAIGENTAIIGTTAAPVSIHTVTTIDGVTVSERDLQRVILGYLTATGEVLTIDADTGLPVSIIDGAFTLTPGDEPMTTGSDIKVVETIPTISTSIYTANDVVGGRITLSSALKAKHTGILQSIFVQFKGNLTPDLDLYLFKSLPTQNTVDNAAFAWSASDDAKLIWVQSVLTANYKTIPGATVRKYAPILPGYPAIEGSAEDLYLYIVAVDGFTAASTSDLRVGFGIARD